MRTTQIARVLGGLAIVGSSFALASAASAATVPSAASHASAHATLPNLSSAEVMPLLARYESVLGTVTVKTMSVTDWNGNYDVVVTMSNNLRLTVFLSPSLSLLSLTVAKSTPPSACQPQAGGWHPWGPCGNGPQGQWGGRGGWRHHDDGQGNGGPWNNPGGNGNNWSSPNGGVDD